MHWIHYSERLLRLKEKFYTRTRLRTHNSAVGVIFDNKRNRVGIQPLFQRIHSKSDEAEAEVPFWLIMRLISVLRSCQIDTFMSKFNIQRGQMVKIA